MSQGQAERYGFGMAASADSDIVPDSERRGLIGALPRPLRPYASLMRLDRPIGAWLLFWPCAWSVALAGMGPQGAWLILWFALGAWAMRSAGCVWNDIVDRDLDARVERTRLRPLASGRASLKGAWVLLAAPRPDRARRPAPARADGADRRARQPGAGRGLSVHEADHLVAAGLARPRLLLGRAGRLAGGARRARARRRSSSGPASVFWVIGYDTIYALQDREDDALVGVRSSALALGRHARAGVAICYAVALALWAVALWRVRPDGLSLVALLPVAGHLAWQAARLRPDDGGDALAKFRSNRMAGFILFLACLVVGTS